MSQQTNSAKRLHQLLSEACNRGSEQKKLREVLSEIFQVKKEDDREIWRCRLLIDEQFETVERELRLAGAESKTWVQRFPRMRKGLLAPGLDASGDQIAKALGGKDSANFEALNAAAARIAEKVGENELNREEIKKIEQELEALSSELERGQFEPRLADVVRELIESLRHAMVIYRIRGIDAFEDAMTQSIGRLALVIKRRCPKEDDASDRSDSRDKEEEAKWQANVKRIWSAIILVEQVVAKIREYGPVLAHTLPPLLGS